MGTQANSAGIRAYRTVQPFEHSAFFGPYCRRDRNLGGQSRSWPPGRRRAARATTAVIEYALAKVALEDDYGAKLLALKGTVPADIDLEF